MIKADKLIEYAIKAVGAGYCWGADGQVCSPKVRRELAGRTSSQSNKNNLLITCAKWDGKRVWDCSGLFRGAWRELSKYRSGGATTIYKSWCNEKGTIDTMPDIPGIAVFRGTPGNMAHIGLYIGNGEVVDARGSSVGVLRGTLQSYGKWTHWGKLTDVDYGEGDEPVVAETKWLGTVKTNSGNGIQLWADEDKTARLASIPESATVNVLEDTRTGMVQASYNGKTGYVDAQYLQANRIDTMRGIFIPCSDPEEFLNFLREARILER